MIELVEIGKCCKIVSGSTPSRIVPEYWDGEINWFTPKDLSGLSTKYVYEAPEKITELGFKSCSTNILPPNSLLFTSRAPIGHLAINKVETCTNQGFKALIPNENVDINYLYYTIKKMVPILQDLGNGATFKELSKSTLEKVKIPLQPLHLQKKIASILDAADEVRQKDKALVAKYNELTQSLFLDMFGDPVSNPKAWKIDVIENLLSKKTINGFFAKNDNYNPDGTPIVWISDFIDKIYVKTNDLKRVSLNKNDLDKYKLTYGDALFCRSSLTVEGIGKCSIVPKDINQDIIFECHIIKLNFSNNIVPEYFRFLSETKYFRNKIKKSAKTSTMTTISQDGITKIKIPVPPLELQNKFAEHVELIEKQKQLAEESLKKSEELFNSLLDGAFKETHPNPSQEGLLVGA